MLSQEQLDLIRLFRSLRSVFQEAANSIQGVPGLLERQFRAIAAGKDASQIEAKIGAGILRMNIAFENMGELWNKFQALAPFIEDLQRGV